MPRNRKSDETLNKGIKILEEYKLKVNEERRKRLSSKNLNKVSSKSKIIKGIVIFIIIVIALLFMRYSTILGIKLIDIELDPITIDNIISNDSIYMEYNNEFLVYNSGTVYTYDNSGNITWTYEISDGFSPSIYSSGKYLLIANKNNGMIYYFSNKKEIANRIIEGNIENVYVNDDGRFVVQYTKDTGYKKVIALYDKEAKLKYQEAYIESSPIIGIEFLKEKNKLLIVQADSSHINIGTKFSILDYLTDNFIVDLVTFDDKLIYNYKMINDEIVYISDKAIEKYNISTNNNEKIHSLNEEQTNFVSLEDNYFIIVETKEDGYEITSKRFDNTYIASNVLKAFPKYVEMSRLLTYIVSETKINVVNKWGVIVKEIDISLSPKNIIVFNNEKSIALIYSNKVQIVNL